MAQDCFETVLKLRIVGQVLTVRVGLNSALRNLKVVLLILELLNPQKFSLKYIMD